MSGVRPHLALVCVLLLPWACHKNEDPQCGTAEVFDGVGCVPEACGMAPFGNKVGPDTLYVDSNRQAKGDGSLDKPYRKLDDALGKARRSGIRRIVLSGTTYPQSIRLDSWADGLELLGRCAERTRVDSPKGLAPTLSISGNNSTTVTLEDLTLSGGANGLEVNGARVLATRLWLLENQGTGLLAYNGAEVEFSSGRVEDTMVKSSGSFGYGVELDFDASLKILDSVVARTQRLGVFAYGEGASIELRNTLVEAIGAGPNGDRGIGVSAQVGSFIELHSVVVRDNPLAGVVATRNARMEVYDSTILGGEPQLPDYGGLGAQAEAGGILLINNTSIEDTHTAALSCFAPGSTMTLTDVAVSGVRASPAGILGLGASVSDGCVFSWNRGSLTEATEAGLGMLGNTTEAYITDLDISSISPNELVPFGRGINMGGGARLEMQGGVIERSYETAVFVAEWGTHATLTGTTIRDVFPSEELSIGMGVNVRAGAEVEINNALIERSTHAGIQIEEANSSAIINNSTIRDIYPIKNGYTGRGIIVQDGAGPVQIFGGTIESTLDVGLLVLNAGAPVDVRGLTIQGVASSRQRSSGVGLAVELGEVRVDGLTITDTEGPGVYVGWDALATMTNIDVQRSSMAGVVIFGGEASISNSKISTVYTATADGGGIGVFAQPWTSPAKLHLTDTTIEDAPLASVWLVGDGSFEIQDNSFSGAQGVPLWDTLSVHGNGVVAVEGSSLWDGSLGLRLAGNTFGDNASHDILLDGSTASLENNSLQSDVLQQNCTSTQAPEELSPHPLNLCPAFEEVVLDLHYSLVLEDPSYTP